MEQLADNAGYGEQVIKRFQAPQRAGAPIGANRVGEAESKPRASRVRLHLRTADGEVVAAGFEALGCPHMIAAADRVCEDLEGKPLEALTNYDARFLEGNLLPADKLDIRILLEDAVRSAARGD